MIRAGGVLQVLQVLQDTDECCRCCRIQMKKAGVAGVAGTRDISLIRDTDAGAAGVEGMREMTDELGGGRGDGGVVAARMNNQGRLQGSVLTCS